MTGLAAIIVQILKFEAEAVWLLGLLAVEVAGHSSIVIYGLVIMLYAVIFLFCLKYNFI